MPAYLPAIATPHSLHLLRAVLLWLAFFLLPGCATQTQVAELQGWPAELPPSQPFRAAWLADTGNQGFQSEQEYLQWVQRFYQGSTLAPGWLEVSNQVLERLGTAERESISRRLQPLGISIGTEWAKDNAERLINTRIVAVWRDALLEALRREDLEAFMLLLEQDVSALIEGVLAPDAIQFERYYTDEFDA
jgi:hypothetical protein